ncbi:MAG: APC family permease [Anaerolineae bacterium]
MRSSSSFLTTINYRGASETGAIGSIATLAEVAMLLVPVVFGIVAMLHTEAWISPFTDGFMPNGFEGVLAAMGLTFITFEGYEVIAQSGEKVVNPSCNIPKTIVLSIAIGGTAYVLVGNRRYWGHAAFRGAEGLLVSGGGGGSGHRRGVPASLPSRYWCGRLALQRRGLNHVGPQCHHLLLLPRRFRDGEGP